MTLMFAFFRLRSSLLYCCCCSFYGGRRPSFAPHSVDSAAWTESAWTESVHFDTPSGQWPSISRQSSEYGTGEPNAEGGNFGSLGAGGSGPGSNAGRLPLLTRPSASSSLSESVAGSLGALMASKWDAAAPALQPADPTSDGISSTVEYDSDI